MKRINELNNQLELQSKTLEEKLAAQREDISQEMKENLLRVKGERDLMEQRYEGKKRQIKELEGEYSNRISELEKIIAVLQEKLSNVENKKFELERKIAAEANNIQEQLRKQKENFQLEKKALATELESLRTKCYDLELQLVEVQTTYDKDLALWQSKNQFLESQKEQYKLELSELQKNFEILVQKFNQSRITEKEEAESSQSALLAKLDNRYQLQLQELREQLKLQAGYSEEKIKKLERDNKKLTQQLLESEKTQDDQLERRLRESMNNERKMTEELLASRKDYENKLNDIQKRLEEEKEKGKAKIQKLEQLYKEADNKRNMMIFEHEKEKAKWSMENGQLMSQQHDYLEQIDLLMQKKDSLQRENDKLLTEIKQLRRISSNMTGSMVAGFGSGLASKRGDMAYSGIDRSYTRGDEKKSTIGTNGADVNLKLSEHNFLDKQL
jgi:chromosome segregation ATPase